MEPVDPDKVSSVELVPVQTESAAPETVPPTEAGLTVTVALLLLAEAHTPLVITAL